MAKFTHKDLMEAMGLNIGDKIVFDDSVYDEVHRIVDNCGTPSVRTSNSTHGIDVMVGREWHKVSLLYTLTEEDKVFIKHLDKDVIRVMKLSAQSVILLDCQSDCGYYQKVPVINLLNSISPYGWIDLEELKRCL